MTGRVALIGIVASCATLAVSARGGQGADADATATASQLLDDARPAAEREAIVKKTGVPPAELIGALTVGMKPGTREEYRRIPWIWRVAIAAGKRNDGPEIVKILERSLPAPGERLDDWQAVVLGGGVINGITQAGDWPGARIDAFLHDKPELEARWRRAIDLASVMSDDPSVPTGTRYDALRMLGTQPWERRGAQLFRYLLKGVHPELQMGAVSGLGDVPSPCSAQAILSGLPHYNETNRNLALDALLRDEGRALALLQAVADRRVSRSDLGDRRTRALLEHPSENVRRVAAATLKVPADPQEPAGPRTGPGAQP